ncbi:MAG: cytochrome c biogenesis protein ResB [Bacillaceae bacterium]|nr:cytochrome c biogenesis protein ResB [Bacillaceae bacterium]
MTQQLQCSCGFNNPEGTEICESCGNPLIDKGSNQLLNMRYEGAARRSQTYSRTIVDKIWNFFSSVKVGIGIIIALLVTSSLGTIFPQQMYIPPRANPALYYYEEYGILGQFYYQLGFHNLYSSWWYMLLMSALAISLIIASIDRMVPLYRSLSNQRITRHEQFLKRQRLFSRSQVVDNVKSIQKIKEQLKSRNYNVREENGNILAEKGRFSRWGPYVNHLGLVIFLIGGMLRFFPGMYVDEYLWIRDGETAVIPGTEGEYYLESHGFLLELYDENDPMFQEAIARQGGNVVKTYQTTATLYQRETTDTIGAGGDLIELDTHNIQVNDPMKFSGFALYQVDYKLHELNKMSLSLEHKESGDVLGDFSVDLYNPEDEYDLGEGYKVKVNDYFPNYYLNDQGLPATQSRIPDNPAFIFEIISPDNEGNEISFIGIGKNLEPIGDNDHKLTLSGIETKHVSALIVRKDYTLGILIVGGVIFMIGLVQGSYWNHRRIWFQQKDNEIWIAAHTNKNWYGMKRELEQITEKTLLNVPIDQVEEREMKKESKNKEETSNGSIK